MHPSMHAANYILAEIKWRKGKYQTFFRYPLGNFPLQFFDNVMQQLHISYLGSTRNVRLTQCSYELREFTLVEEIASVYKMWLWFMTLWEIGFWFCFPLRQSYTYIIQKTSWVGSRKKNQWLNTTMNNNFSR